VRETRERIVRNQRKGRTPSMAEVLLREYTKKGGGRIQTRLRTPSFGLPSWQ